MKFLKKILNSRLVLSSYQTFVGANQWKSQLYKPYLRSGGSLLDFGCSYGNTTPALLEYDYYGIDIDEQAINSAKKRFERYPNVHFFCIDILSQKFKVSFFDQVLFASTGHHLSDDQLNGIVTALLNTLKAGGVLHFFDIIRQDADPFSTRLLTRLDQGKFIRTLDQYKEIFDKKLYPIVSEKVIPSPQSLIKLWDFYYIKMIKKHESS